MSRFFRASLPLFLLFPFVSPCVSAWPQQTALKIDRPDAPPARTNLKPKHRARANGRPGQLATTQNQGTVLLQQSITALIGSAVLSDVTLSGSAHRIAGSDDETGTATLKAISGNASVVNLSLPSGQRTETLNCAATLPGGSRSGPDGVTHPISHHNLLTDSAWFFPAFTVGRLLGSANYVVSYVGQETHSGRAVQHITLHQSSNFQTPSGIPTYSHLTQIDLFLDSGTLLPAAMDFNVHPDNDMGLDIPIEIVFSDYRAVNGVQIPFRVQKYLNNGLILDLQFQSASLNTGLPASLFTIPQKLSDQM